MSGQAICPQCGTTVESDWEWCHACGFDPEGNRPPDVPVAPSFEPGEPEHPYADLPYTREPEPASPGGYGQPGLTPAGPVVDHFGPTRPSGPGVGPGAGGGYAARSGPARPTSPPPGAGGQPAFGASGYGTPGYGAPGFGGITPAGPGFKPAPVASNSGRTILVVMLAILVVGIIGVGLVKVSSDSTTAGPKPTTTRDPKAPPPIGAVVGNAPSTVAGAPSTLPAPTTIPVPTDGWVQYHAPDGTFQVDLPGKPVVQGKYFAAPGQQLDALEVLYEVGVDGGGYSIFYVTLPSAAYYADSRAAFEYINEQNKADGSPVLNDAGDITVDGVTGVRFTAEYHGRPERGAVVVKGLRIYEIDALDIDDANFDRFLASFHILKDPV